MELDTGPPSILELGAGPLSHVLKFLPLLDLIRASEVCRTLHQAAQDDSVWQAKALELYPAETVRLGDCYTSYCALVRDDNAEHAALLLPLEGRSCRYKSNEPHHYYECLVLALEWNRVAHTFRLYIDARGEVDLRQPVESSLGFLVHRGPPPDRISLRQHLERVTLRRQLVVQELAEVEAQDCMHSVLVAQHELARCDTQIQQLRAELGVHLELSFADLLTVVRPSGQHLVVDRLGHKLGWLEFDSLDKVDVLLCELPNSYASKQHAEQRGVDLCFSYANPIPVMPHGALVDYEPAIVATVPPGTSLLCAFKSMGHYAVPGQMLRELEQEGRVARWRRWIDHGLPLAVRDREPPWLV